MDLFAGAGGLSNGFEQTKQFEISVAVENNKYAQETFKANHKNVTMFDDINNIEYFEEDGKLKSLFKDIDIIIGGPPCQGFSNANRQRNTLISNNNRLVKEYLKAIEYIKPRAFVMENVPAMESDKHKFFVAYDDLEELRTLDIKTKEEKILIGSTTPVSVSLIEFLEDIDMKAISNVVLPRSTYSKLNSLLKKLKAGNTSGYEYLQKPNNTSFFKGLLSNSDIYDFTWSKDYSKVWVDFIYYLKLYINTQEHYHVILKYLEIIIETQKVIMKYQEVLNQNIKHAPPFLMNDGVYIKLESYNVFNFIITKLRSLGYLLNDEQKIIFNAADYGVPQSRKRLILIGIKNTGNNEAVKIPKPLFANQEEYFTIFDAIKDLESIEPEVDINLDANKKNRSHSLSNNALNRFLNGNCEVLYNHIRTESTKAAIERFKALKQGENFHNLSDDLKTTYSNPTRTQNTVYKRLNYNKPSDTVINVRKSMWVHPTKDRALSIREAARLQSFQDQFIFFGTKDAQYQQIGNAVPPLFARAIAESVLESLNQAIIYPLKNELNPLQSKENIHATI